MSHKVLSVAMIASLSLFLQVSFAADECSADKDCKDGKVCVLALTPHVCKAPQAAGATCKRDVVCASKKCDIPAGKDAGTCK
ncbi:MAG: Dickkopf N-terminal cysteine-rich domain-containing protein [Pseudomonadota bacterium]